MKGVVTPASGLAGPLPAGAGAARASLASAGSWPDDWPHAAVSREVDAGGLRWHVQRMGAGPSCLLIHGTGASTHTWRDMMPLLGRHFDVVAIDLPGHGFSGPLPPAARPTLPAMGRAVVGLLETLDCAPAVAVGHSAGAAILARMALDEGIRPAHLVALNGAFFPFNERMNTLFSGVARAFATAPLMARLVARRGREPRAVERLMETTGSRLDGEGIELYARLLGEADHVRSVLSMMANWDLSTLADEMIGLRPALHLVVGANDRTVSPGQARRLQEKLPAATLDVLPGLGHLAHEEAPARVVKLIEQRIGEGVSA